MRLNVWQSVRAVIACILAMLFIFPAGMVAQSHVVSPTELQQQVTAASQARQHNIETLQQLFSTPAAEKALKSAKMDPQQVKTAVSTLSDEDLGRLSARADRAQADFAGGRLSDRDLILILIGIAVLVLIIVAVR